MLPGVLRCVERGYAVLSWDDFRVSAEDAGVQAGLVHFTRSISGTLAKSGVRLCCLCPQPVDTPMVSTMQSAGLPMPETGASLLTPQRVGHWGCSPTYTLVPGWGQLNSSEELPGTMSNSGMDSAGIEHCLFCELEQPCQFVREC